MIYLVWGLLGCLSVFKKNDKMVTLLLALFILCVFCFNTANRDLVSYMESYDGFARHYSEPGLLWLESFFRDAGVSYVVFKFILTGVSLFLIISTIYKFSPYPNFVLYLYTIYPMSIDVTQYRFFLGYAVALFSIRFILSYQAEKKIKYIFLYILFILLATVFHYSCFAFLFLSVLFLNHKERPILFFIVIPLIPIIFMLYRNRLIPVIGPIIGGGKVYTWLIAGKATSYYNILRILLCNLLPLLFLLLLTYVKRNDIFGKIYESKVPIGIGVFFKNIPRKIAQDANMLYDLEINKTLFLGILYITSFTMPLELMLSDAYHRFNRLTLILCAILISRMLFYFFARNKLIAQVMLLFLFLFCFAATMCMGVDDTIYFDCVFRQVMESNSLFGIIY